MAMKFCPKCGSRLGEGFNVCPSCGFKLSSHTSTFLSAQGSAQGSGGDAPRPILQAPPRTATRPQPQLRSNTQPQPYIPPPLKTGGVSAKEVVVFVRKFVILLLVLTVIVVGAKVCMRIFLTPYRAGVDNFVKALNAEDYEDARAYFHYYFFPVIIEDSYFDDYMENHWKTYTDEMEDEYGDDIKYSYKFISAAPMSNAYLENLELYVGGLSSKNIVISEGYSVKAQLRLKSDKRSKKEEVTLDVIKLDDKWMVASVRNSSGEYPKLLSLN